MWDFGDIKASKLYEKVVDNLDTFPGTKWFPGAELNFAENLLKYSDTQLAFIFQGENKIHKEMNYKELNQTVARLAKSLIDMGIKKGDRVVSYIPNLIETPTAMLATSSIGAIWASLFWVGAKILFGMYLSNFTTFSRIYGAYALGIVVAFWIYYTSAVFILGAEIGKLFDERITLKLEKQKASNQLNPIPDSSK